MNTVIVSGPQGCGKNLAAQELQREYGCAAVVDEWAPGQVLAVGALHLTHTPPSEINERRAVLLAFDAESGSFKPYVS